MLIGGSHYVVLQVSKFVTPQQEAQASHLLPQEAQKASKHSLSISITNTFVAFYRLHFKTTF